ncbi:MAG: L-aspartate oxidase [Zetaproteobacteria bacterium]|nr:L-aspartate oxidase [Zetaproteobacteria bacterium]
MKQHSFDYLIIGSGAAGLFLAQRLANHGRVALVNKSPIFESNTYWAQGGIAGVYTPSDSIEAHVQDTLLSGAGLCHEAVVREVAECGGEVIRELIRIGTPFDTLDAQSGNLHLTKEGGHSERRIAHAKDATGRALIETLVKLTDNHGQITHFENHMVIDLITTQRLGYLGEDNRCLGAYLLDANSEILTIAAEHTILATGGAGKVYMYTSNPHAATGDGIAMAWRAGCRVMNLELMQFHPTCLFHASAPTMLITEALRGEGAVLIDKRGRRFAFDYHPQGELAPRDIVARAIDHEMKKQGQDCMFLDARPLGASLIHHHFPNMRDRLLENGIDMLHAPIPVVPAAHYMCGGVKSDLAGRTDVQSLYAIGETACTGLHGANRLASNSLLECLVMAQKCAETILTQPSHGLCPARLPTWDDSGVVPETERIQIKQNWDEIRAIMSNYVGIVRSNERLYRAKRRLHVIQEEVDSHYWKFPISRDLIELRNLCQVAELIVRSAQKRRESRGLHYSTDYPITHAQAEDTIIDPKGY